MPPPRQGQTTEGYQYIDYLGPASRARDDSRPASRTSIGSLEAACLRQCTLEAAYWFYYFDLPTSIRQDDIYIYIYACMYVFVSLLENGLVVSPGIFEVFPKMERPPGPIYWLIMYVVTHHPQTGLL